MFPGGTTKRKPKGFLFFVLCGKQTSSDDELPSEYSRCEHRNSPCTSSCSANHRTKSYPQYSLNNGCKDIYVYRSCDALRNNVSLRGLCPSILGGTTKRKPKGFLFFLYSVQEGVQVLEFGLILLCAFVYSADCRLPFVFKKCKK